MSLREEKESNRRMGEPYIEAPPVQLDDNNDNP